MRTAIVLAGSLLFASSALVAEPKPIVLAVAKISTSEAVAFVEKVARVSEAETQVLEGSLEGFGATGLAQFLTVADVSTSQTAKVASSVAKETHVAEGSLEKFGATGLPQ